MITGGAKLTCLVSGHCKRVNITLICRVAVLEVELPRIEQLRSCVTDSTEAELFQGIRHISGIHHDAYNPKVRQACGIILANQDVSLDRTAVSTGLKLRVRSALTGLTLPCTMLSECKCSRPHAACASCRTSVKQFSHGGCGRSLTSSNRLTPSLFWIYSRIFPC